MGSKTGIEWTEEVWNPVRGCALVSPGCTNCYAMRQAHRFSAYAGLTKMSKGGPVWTGEVRTVRELLTWPLRRRTPSRIFVNSMSDLFHDDVPEAFIDQVFTVMAHAERHQFQVLTKRPTRMLDYLGSQPLARRRWEAEGRRWGFAGFSPPPVLPNVWLGVSVEDQARADERIPLLLQTPAAVRWISAEPLLGPVVLKDPPNDMGEPRFSYLEYVDGTGPRIDWVVAGGESGPGARPMHPDWVRSLRDQCAAAGVPFFFKQWGAYAPLFPQYHDEYRFEDNDDGCTGRDFPDEGVLYRTGYFYDGLEHQPHTGVGAYWIERVGKRAAGRHLDGRTHDEYPR